MIPPPFRYLKATSTEDALVELDKHSGSAVLAGGQTMVNALKLDLVAPSVLVDIHRIPELRGIDETEEWLRIGTAVTYAELATDPLVALRVPMLSEVSAALVDRQVRNRGTIGGNCCLNDPTSNLPPLLAALGARFEVCSHRDGVESFDAAEFFVDSLLTRAHSPKLLTAVHVPTYGSSTFVAYRHQQVAADSWAIARAVVRVDLDAVGSVSFARVVLGAVPGSPLRLATVEESLLGRPLTEDASHEALSRFDAAEVETRSDSHGSAAYRLAMARVQLSRALTDVRINTAPRKEAA